MSKQYGRFARHLTLGCALTCLIAAGSPGVARAEEDKLDQMFSNVLTGLGLKKDGSSPGIDYRERSPLVIPPKRELPPPDTGASVRSNPAWPIDPDVQAQKDAAAGKNQPVDEDGVLRPDKMTPGRKAGKTVRIEQGGGTAPRGTDGNEAARPLPPSALGYNGGFFGMFKAAKDEETGTFVNEPPRASLTDPPSGYQTPSPNSPYGLGKDRTPIKPGDYQLEHGTQPNN